MSPADPVLALVGATASGKSAVALEVARRCSRPIEIVAADAFTLYRGMDVGTAKPSPEERAEVPHHLVDVLAPTEETSVAWFQGRARAVIAEVHARGAVPLLVGGSGLYWRAVVDDLRFPPTDPDVRARLEARFAGDPEAAHVALREADPDAAAKIEPANLRRSVRALEVIELTGERYSAYDDAFDHHRSVYPGLDARGLAVDRRTLRARIAARARRMVDQGLVDEARELAGRGLSATAEQAIGYAEALAHLRGELDPEELVDAITTRTWRYARRQLAWFRKDPRIRWSAPDEIVAAWT